MWVSFPAPQVTLRGYLTLERPISWPGPFCCVWTWRGIKSGQRSVTLWSHYCLRCWTPWAESAPISTCLCARVTRACSSCSDCSSLEVCQTVSVLESSKVCEDNTDSLLQLSSPPSCICSMYSRRIGAFVQWANRVTFCLAFQPEFLLWSAL